MPILLFFLSVPFCLSAQTQVSFNNWVQRGALANGTWVYDPSNEKLTQTTNGDPTFYVSNDNYRNKAVEGRFKVATTSDDDMVGFVLGFESAVDHLGNSNKFLLIDWKQLDQTLSGVGTARAEIRLSYFNTTQNQNDIFWVTQTANNTWGNIAVYEPSSSFSGVNSSGGWVDNFTYRFKAVYTESNVKIYFDFGNGVYTKVFDVNASAVPFFDTFPEGKFGFYNFSQDDVIYDNFTIPNGDLSIVSSGGGTEGVDWQKTGTTIIPLSGDAKINASQIQTFLNSSDITIVCDRNISVESNLTIATANKLTLNSKGNISLNSNIASAGDLLFKSFGNIALAASKSITITTATGDVIFWSDADVSSGGSISLGSAAAVQTSGGRIVMAGGLDNGSNGGVLNDGIPDGYARGVGVPGISTTGSFTLDAGAGNIILRGSSSTKDGVLLSASTIGSITTTSGNIDINGFVDAGIVTSGQIQSGIRTVGGGIITLDSGTGLINLVGNGPRHGLGFGISDAVSSDGATQTLIKSANTTSDAIKIRGTAGAGGHGVSFRGASTKLHATAALGGITVDAVAPGWTTTIYNPIEFLAVSGPINWLNSDATDGIYTNSSSIVLGSKAGVTGLTTSSSNITFNLKKTFANLNLGIGTIGQVTIQGVNGTASFGQAFSTSDFGLNANGQTMSSFVFGSPGNTQAITIGQSLAVAGPVSVYGGNITIDGNITTSAGNANGDILLKGTGNVVQNGSKTIITNGGDVTIWADSDGNGSGYVQASASSSISSGGGNVVLGGGANIATGYARGAAIIDNSSNSYISGVHLMTGTSINSAGGNITLRGQNVGNSNAYVQAGIMGMGTILNAGAGKVSLVGLAGGSGSANSQGISIKDFNTGWTIQSSNPNSDAIVLLGDASSTSNSSTSLGINFAGSIVSTGGGGVSLEGKAGPASSYDQGLDIRGDILANSGTITLIGQNDVASQTAIFFGLTPSVGFKNGTSVTSSLSNIVLKSDNTVFSTTTNLNTTGNVTIEPYSNSFTNAITFPIANLALGNGISSLTLGKSTNTSNITFGNATSIAGPITIYGSTISLNQNIASSTGGLISLLGNTVALGAPITLVNGDVLLGSSTVVNGSSTNYFKTTGTGTLKRAVANGASFTYPVGNGAYNPVTIANNTGSADQFSVRVADAVLSSGTSGTAIADKVVNRTWHIGKTNSNGSSGVDMTFEWNANEELGTLSDYKLSHFGNSAWAVAAGTSGTVSVNGSIKTMTHTGYTGTFSPFAIGSSTSVLPVTWLSFTGKKVQQGIELNWSTSSEQNTKDFQVQHSINVQQWTSVGNLPAAGNSSTVRNYRFVHEGPFKNSMQHYYRILQRDLDGKFSYSKVIRIEYPDAATDVVLYPNPASDVLHINITERQELRLVNMQGVVVWKGVLPAGRHEIPVANFAAGNYILQAGKGTYKVMIQ